MELLQFCWVVALFLSRGFKTTPETFWGKPQRNTLALVSPKQHDNRNWHLESELQTQPCALHRSCLRHCKISLLCTTGVWTLSNMFFMLKFFLTKPFCHILPIHEFARTLEKGSQWWQALQSENAGASSRSSCSGWYSSFSIAFLNVDSHAS